MALIERSFRERIVMVGTTIPPADDEVTDAHLDELELLLDTAGADVVGRVTQRLSAPDPATFVGKGKAEELRQLAESTDCDTVVFDDELSPAQSRNLEKLLGRTAIDRTAVILDIFAQNAHTREGKAQVQLAMYRYRLPRLRGRGLSLSQQAGGIGARRGPGETQLEVDRRRILRRVTALEAELRDATQVRRTQRKARQRGRNRTVAIVGYTNAGKSTLLNRLTDAGVLVADRLFATLDPTVRRLQLPGGEAVLVSDTVGFVRKLPHTLVQAFRSTLEEVAETDLLLHLVDASGPEPRVHIDAVHEVLSDIGAGELPQLVVFNKVDRADPDDVKALLVRHPGSVAVSAVTGAGMDDLLVTLSDRLRALDTIVELLVPYERGDVLAALHREGEVLGEHHEESATRLRARLDATTTRRFREFVVA